MSAVYHPYPRAHCPQSSHPTEDITTPRTHRFIGPSLLRAHYKHVWCHRGHYEGHYKAATCNVGELPLQSHYTAITNFVSHYMNLVRNKACYAASNAAVQQQQLPGGHVRRARGADAAALTLTPTPTLTPTLTLIQSISGMSFLIASGLVLMAGITGVVYIRTQVCARVTR